MSKISEAEVRRLAHLARLGLSDDEVHAMQGELDAVLESMAAIDALDLEGVPPTLYPIPHAAALRDDTPTPPLRREEALAAAPKETDGGFAVPRVLEGH